MKIFKEHRSIDFDRLRESEEVDDETFAYLDEDEIEADEHEYDDEYELETADQEITSSKTSINSSKLPAIFNLVSFTPGTMNLDYGGGKFDNAAEYLSTMNVENLVYDPYNRSASHNQSVIRKLRDNGGADSVTCSNVLNVIKEPEARMAVIRNIKVLAKSGAPIYFTVYEGNKSSEGKPTSSGYQLNRPTADYLDEISEVFPDASKKGKLIVAHK